MCVRRVQVGYSPFYAESAAKIQQNICNARVRFPRAEADDDGAPAAALAAAPAAAPISSTRTRSDAAGVGATLRDATRIRALDPTRR